MADVKEMLEKALEISDSNRQMVDKYHNELLPNYFFMAFILGSEFKDIEKLKKKMKNAESVKHLVELYNIGKNNTAESLLGITCKKCGKNTIKEEGVYFCKFCGEKLD